MSNVTLDLLVGALIAYLLAITVVLLVLGSMTHQAWIALDQFVHCLFYKDAMADETFSARCWREYVMSSDPKATAKWERRVALIDSLFFDENHCRDSYYAERDGEQLPEGYRDAQ